MGSLLIVLSTLSISFSFVFICNNLGELWGVATPKPHAHQHEIPRFHTCLCFPLQKRLSLKNLSKLVDVYLVGTGSKLKKNRETIWVNYKEFVPWDDFEKLNFSIVLTWRCSFLWWASFTISWASPNTVFSGLGNWDMFCLKSQLLFSSFPWFWSGPWEHAERGLGLHRVEYILDGTQICLIVLFQCEPFKIDTKA